jgi:hypothetical protein
VRGLTERTRERYEAMQTQAWLTAALTRSKRLTPLKQLLHPPKTRALTDEEHARRQAEFDDLKRRMEGAIQKHAGSRAGQRVRPDSR